MSAVSIQRKPRRVRSPFRKWMDETWPLVDAFGAGTILTSMLWLLVIEILKAQK